MQLIQNMGAEDAGIFGSSAIADCMKAQLTLWVLYSHN